jgi:hypothetical protein
MAAKMEYIADSTEVCSVAAVSEADTLAHHALPEKFHNRISPCESTSLEDKLYHYSLRK